MNPGGPDLNPSRLENTIINRQETPKARPKFNEVFDANLKQRKHDISQSPPTEKSAPKSSIQEIFSDEPNTNPVGSVTTLLADVTSKTDKKSEARLSIMWGAIKEKGSATVQSMKGVFVSAIHHLKSAFAGEKTASEKSSQPQELSARKTELNNRDLKPVTEGSNIPNPKLALRKLLKKEHPKLSGSIKIHYGEPTAVANLKTAKISHEGTHVTINYTSKPYGAAGEKDSHLNLIAGDEDQGGNANKFAQEEVENEKHPVLTAMAQSKDMGKMRIGEQGIGGQSRGAFLKGVPQQCEINPFKSFSYKAGDKTISEKGIYGDQFNLVYQRYLKNTGEQDSPKVAEKFIKMLMENEVIVVLKEPKEDNILYMVAPRAFADTREVTKLKATVDEAKTMFNMTIEEMETEVNKMTDAQRKEVENYALLQESQKNGFVNTGQGGVPIQILQRPPDLVLKSKAVQAAKLYKEKTQVTSEQGYDLLNAFAQPFIAALKVGEKVLPFGPVGTGAFSNNYQFSIVMGLLAADYAQGVVQVDNIELVYHDPGSLGVERKSDYDAAVQYFDREIKQKIKNGESIETIMNAIVAHAQTSGWVNSPPNMT